MVHEGSWACCRCGVGDLTRGYRHSENCVLLATVFVPKESLCQSASPSPQPVTYAHVHTKCMSTQTNVLQNGMQERRKFSQYHKNTLHCSFVKCFSCFVDIPTFSLFTFFLEPKGDAKLHNQIDAALPDMCHETMFPTCRNTQNLISPFIRFIL